MDSTFFWFLLNLFIDHGDLCDIFLCIRDYTHMHHWSDVVKGCNLGLC